MLNHILEFNLPSSLNVYEVQGTILTQIKISQCSTPTWPLVRYCPSTKHDESYFRIPSAYFVKCRRISNNKTTRKTSFVNPLFYPVGQMLNSKTFYKTCPINKKKGFVYILKCRQSCSYKRFLVGTDVQTDGQIGVTTIYE